jgi:Mrp family chromosome partitioning ATPase
VDQETVDFGTRVREQLRALREQKWLLIACVVLTTAAALAYALTRTELYQASSRILLQESDLGTTITGLQGGGQLPDPEREVATALELALQPAVAQRVVREVDFPITADELLTKTKAAAEGNSRLLSFTVVDPDPARAAVLANAYARQYVNYRRDTNREAIERAVNGVRAQLQLAEAGDQDSRVQSLQQQLGALELLNQVESGNAQFVQPARTPADPFYPKPVRTGVLGLLVGLLLGIGLVALRDRMDHRLKREEDLERLLPGVPVIAAIPSWRLEPTDALQSEGFRALQTTLSFLDSDRTLRSLLVTSATIGEGKTTTTLNLALAMAERDESVVVLEADLRRRGLSERLGLESRPGVANVLHGEGAVDDFLVRVPLNDDLTRGDTRANGSGGVAAPALTGTLSVVPAGLAHNPHSLLTADRLRRLLDQATEVADKVVIDGTPLGLLTDMLPIAGRVDAVVVVVHLYHTRRNELKRLADQLAHARIKPFGLVVFGVQTDRAYDAYMRR